MRKFAGQRLTVWCVDVRMSQSGCQRRSGEFWRECRATTGSQRDYIGTVL